MSRPLRAALSILMPMATLVALTGCGTAEESTASSGSASPTLDCGAARTAMGDYSVALTDLAQSLDAGDRMSAVAAADALSYAAGQVVAALPGAPAEAAQFAVASDGVARLVKEAMAGQGDVAAVIPRVTEAFGASAFTVGGDALDDFADQACPEQPAASESATAP